MLAVYISGHGFGHSTRTAEVLAELRRAKPGLTIQIATSAPAFLFDGLDVPVRPLACDVGLVQRGPLVIDEDATAAACAAFEARWPGLVAGEARWLRESGARLVLGDIPPLAFAAASAAVIIAGRPRPRRGPTARRACCSSFPSPETCGRSRGGSASR